VRRFGFHGLSYTSRRHRRTRSESTRGESTSKAPV
jgi:hypothetical protein